MSNIKSMYRCVVCFLRADIGLFQHHVLKTLPLSCCVAFVPLSQISGLHLCIPASGLSVLSHWFIYLFFPTVSWFLWLYHEAWLRRASALWLCSSPSVSCLLSCAFCFSIYTLESIGQYPPSYFLGRWLGVRWSSCLPRRHDHPCSLPLRAQLLRWFSVVKVNKDLVYFRLQSVLVTSVLCYSDINAVLRFSGRCIIFFIKI